MALRNLIYDFRGSATATVATLATLEGKKPPKNANCRTVATVAVAEVENDVPVLLASIPKKAEIKVVLSPENGARQTARTTIKLFPLTWLQEHRQELIKMGWTGRELYRRNRSKGIVWLSIWSKPGLQVDIAHGGIIEFRFDSIKQTARPLGFFRKPKSRGAMI